MNSMMTKYLAYAGIVAAVILISLLVFNANNKSVSNSSMQTVNIGYVNLPISLVAYVAIDKGFFEKYGLHAKLTSFTTEDQYVDAMNSNQIDCAYPWSTSVLFNAEQIAPGSYKIFQVLTYPKNDSYTAIIVKNNSTIIKASDLIGKRIAIFPGPSSNVLSTLAIEKVFGSKDAVKLIQVSPLVWLPSLTSGNVDGIFSWEPFHTIMDSANLTQVVVDSPFEQIMDKIPASVSICSTSFINKHPDSAAKIKLAFDDAVDYLNAHTDDSRELFLKFNSTTIHTEKIAMTVHLPTWEKVNPDNTVRLQKYADLLTENSFLHNKMNVSSMLYNPTVQVSP